MRPIVSAFVTACCIVLNVLHAADPQIPDLQWEPRSDWINVKSDVSPAAIGDGKADDTAALQKALDTLSVEMGQRCTVYFPPGLYRITKTLVLRHRDGIMLIGSGRSTRIVWDGPGGAGDDSRMFWSDGAPRSVYRGILWDGNHKAHTGFDHDSHNFFETEIDHRDEAFIHFTGSGIRCGHDQARPHAQASAETSIVNCLFDDCDRGVELLQFNDYNFTIAGCEFRDCITAVHGGKGCNFYVRDSHFERSRSTDVFLHAEHSCSIRRCTSVGSHQFVDHNCIAPLTIEDCQVSGWTNSDGAVFVNDGPVILFDCVFLHAPTPHPPVVCVPPQPIILSGNQSSDTAGKVTADGATGAVEIPPGHFGGSLGSPDQRFLDETPEKSGKVLDARRDFGAKGDGQTDDTKAIQALVDAARGQGQDAVAYLPSGDYLVFDTLHVSGSNFVIAGCGIHSRLLWRGAPDGVIVEVREPHNVSIFDLDVGEAGQQNNRVDILQIGGGNSSIHYRHIWAYGMYSLKPFTKGFECRGLTSGDVIRADHFTGNLHFVDSSRGTALFNTSYEGAITVEGKSAPDGGGMLGFMTRLATGNIHGLYVRNSQSIVMSDYYVESADHLLDIRGDAGDAPGRITISMAKTHCLKNPVIEIGDYQGQITLGPSMFYPGMINPAEIVHRGGGPLTFILMACEAYDIDLHLDLGIGTQRIFLANGGKGPANEFPNGQLTKVADALDDLRKLGALDLKLNYPMIKAPLH